MLGVLMANLSLVAQAQTSTAPTTPPALPVPVVPPARPPPPSIPAGATALQYRFAQMDRYASANSQLPPPGEGEKRVIFFGDSITDNWKGKDFFPDKNYIDRGISGQTTTQLMVRFPYDVAALHPAVVVILVGTNDIAQNMGPISFEEITRNIGLLASMAETAGIRPIVCSILPCTEFSWHKGVEPAEKIRTVNQMVQDWCNAHQVAYVDYYSALVDANHGLPKTLSGDGVHPNSAGYAIMSPLAESAVEKALAQGPVTPPPAQ